MDVRTSLLHDSALEAEGVSPTQRALFRAWERTGGRTDAALHADLLALSDHLVLFGMPVKSDIPQITHVGGLSLAGRVLGAGWRSDVEAAGISDTVAAAYLRACAGEPVLEHVTCETCRGARRYHLEYKRLVLMVRTPKGYPFLATYSELERLDCAPRLSTSPGTRPGPSRPASSRVLLGSDAAPIAAHSLSA